MPVGCLRFFALTVLFIADGVGGEDADGTACKSPKKIVNGSITTKLSKLKDICYFVADAEYAANAPNKVLFTDSNKNVQVNVESAVKKCRSLEATVVSVIDKTDQSELVNIAIHKTGYVILGIKIKAVGKKFGFIWSNVWYNNESVTYKPPVKAANVHNGTGVFMALSPNGDWYLLRKDEHHNVRFLLVCQRRIRERLIPTTSRATDSFNNEKPNPRPYLAVMALLSLLLLIDLILVGVTLRKRNAKLAGKNRNKKPKRLSKGVKALQIKTPADKAPADKASYDKASPDKAPQTKAPQTKAPPAKTPQTKAPKGKIAKK